MKLKNSSLLRNQCFIDGRWIGASSGQSIEVNNPSNGTSLSHVPKMGTAETRQAIEAAARAFPMWSAKTPKERSEVLRRWSQLVAENLDDLATIMTTEQGKPFPEAQGEVRYSANLIEWFAEEAKRIYGDVIAAPVKNQRLFVIKQPVGVVGAITPWNFPSAMIARKAATALATGCTMVLKPAESTPFSAFALAHLAEQAGVPPGVLSVLTGDPIAIGKELTQNPLVRKITFTGSTRVGKILMEQSAKTVKRITLELGGSAPFLIFADADLDAAINGVIASKFRNSGQTCICAQRIYVEDKIHDVFVEKLIKAVQKLKVGDGFEPGVTQGPLINEAAVEKVEAHIADAVAKGAHVACGGKRHKLGHSFFEPTVVSGAKINMQVALEETFGPLAPIFKFHNEEEAIHMANHSEYGLASYFYSRDIDRVWRVAEKIETGMVSVNGGLFASEMCPFGGIKESGFGREGSKYGVDDFLHVKTICLTMKD